MNVITTTTGLTLADFVRDSFEATYVKDANMRYRVSNGSAQFTDLTNALCRGKECLSITFTFEDQSIFANYIMDEFNGDVKALFDHYNQFRDADQPFGQTLSNELSPAGMMVYYYDYKGIYTFSPFNLKKITPLKSVPKKWNVANAIKAIVNNQVSEFRCTSSRRDDTAKGEKYLTPEERMELVKEITQNGSGWWSDLQMSKTDGTVRLCCHHFDCYSFKFSVAPQPEPQPQPAPQPEPQQPTTIENPFINVYVNPSK